MRRIGLTLAALATLATAVSPIGAHAQDKAKPITKEQRAKGMKDAPAVVQSAGLTCTVTDAYYVGASTQKDSKGKETKADIYEAACKEGLGYIIVADAAAPKAYDCLTTLGSASLMCKLPGNADPKQGLAPMVASASPPCTIKDARAMGGTTSGDTYYEVACQEDAGYILQTSKSAAPKITSCLRTLDSSLACKLTSKDQLVASVGRIAAKSGRPCQISDARFLGETNTGESYFEVACGSQAGYVVKADKAGAFEQAVGCADAAGLAGGCKFTDITTASTAEASTYSGAAKAAGYDCTVAKYRLIGMVDEPTRSEVVELACSNRPDGIVARFPADPKAKAQFLDCVKAGRYANGACQLTSNGPILAKYTAALFAKGRTSCKVSGAKFMASTANSEFIETACADGGPGWVMELADASDTPTSLMSCGQAASQLKIRCALPTNVKP